MVMHTMLYCIAYCIVLYCVPCYLLLYTALYCIVYCIVLYCILLYVVLYTVIYCSLLLIHQHHIPCLWLKKLLLFSLVVQPLSTSPQFYSSTFRGLLWTTILFSVENSFSFGAFSLATKPFSSDSQLAETPHKGGYPLEWLWESADTKSKIKNTLEVQRANRQAVGNK